MESSNVTYHVSAEDIRKLVNANPDIDILDLNFSLLNRKMNWGELNQEEAYSSIRSYQRLTRVTNNFDISEKLIKGGLISAHHIADIPQRTFIKEKAPALGIGRDQAKKLHRRALRIQNKALHAWAAIRGSIASPIYRNNNKLQTTTANLEETFINLPSYQELFGNLDYCECSECRSIFGPAAYLVDLLRIIDKYVTAQHPNIPASFRFEARRPDIMNIKLTCDNTNQLIPYIQIVNERLLAFVQSQLGATSSDDTLQKIANDVSYPSVFPFNYPLSEIITIINTMGVNYYDLLQTWNSDTSNTAARSIGVSIEQQKIIATTDTTTKDICTYFNVQELSILSNVDTFMRATNLNFVGMEELINEDLSDTDIASGLQANFFINQNLTANNLVAFAKDDKDNVIINNLVITALDQINRLIRLSQAFNWPVSLTDWALRAVKAGNTPIIDNKIFDDLMKLNKIADSLTLSVIEACPLLGPIKSYGQGDNQNGNQFDLLFNTHDLVVKQGEYHPSNNPLNKNYSDTPLSWTPGDDKTFNAINRILPGLRLSLGDITALGLALFGNNSTQLTVQNISALYRHSLLSRQLNLKMDKYLLLLKQINFANVLSPTADEILKFINYIQTLSKSGMSTYQLVYITTGSKSTEVNSFFNGSEVNLWLQGVWKLITPSSPDVEMEIKNQLSLFFGKHISLINIIIPPVIIATPLPQGVKDWKEAFLAVNSDGKTPLYGDYIEAVLQGISRWLVLYTVLNLSEYALDNIIQYPEGYEIPSNFASISWTSIYNIYLVQSMQQSYGSDPQGNAFSFIATAVSGGDVNIQANFLASLTGRPVEQIIQLLNGPLKSSNNATKKLQQFELCFKIIDKLAANPSFIEQFVNLATLPSSANWQQYKDLAAALLSKAASSYGSSWSSISSNLNGALELKLRDALLALTLSKLNTLYPDITNTNNVYEFFLIDVNIGTENQISYIKEALNAAQLYLQRARLKIEPGIQKLDIPPIWWDWILNYRVWQANREIFVYPENYMVPTLRKSTTSQFDQLGTNLQQTVISTVSVDKAIQQYINDFDTIAQLKPVEAYRTLVNDAERGEIEVTYLFAHTNTSPKTYYYTYQEDGFSWTPWTKINLSINSSIISPIYAFGRLFIFWVDIKKATNSEIKASGSNSVSSNSTVYNISIYYSFLNQQGEWVQPQTLENEEVIFYKSNDSNKTIPLQSNLFDGAFELDTLAWQKLFVFNTAENNYLQNIPTSTNVERICILYGPPLTPLGSQISSVSITDSQDENASMFCNAVNYNIANNNRNVLSQSSGSMLVRKAVIMNQLLQHDTLLNDGEFLLLDPYQSATPLSWIKAEKPKGTNIIQIVHHNTPITTNYLGDSNDQIGASTTSQTINGQSFINESINASQSLAIFSALQKAGIINNAGIIQQDKLLSLDLFSLLQDITVFNTFSTAQYILVQKTLFSYVGATQLFSNISILHSSVSGLNNQPGWFLFNNGDEVFLISPTPSSTNHDSDNHVAFTSLQKGLTITPPPVKQTSFIMNYNQNQKVISINSKLSASIHDTLHAFDIIDDNGLVTDNATLDNVTIALGNLVVQKQITSDQIPVIYNAVKSYPIIFDNAFITSKIDKTLSTQIYSTLQNYAIIDSSGRVSQDNLSGPNIEAALGNLLMQGQVSTKDLPPIFNALAKTPAPTTLQYKNSGWANSITKTNDFKFNITRLSTGAVPALSRALFVGGIDQLLQIKTQQIPVKPILPFTRLNPSSTNLIWPKALDGAGVDFEGLYGQYYWEIFYHIPLLISYLLNTSGRYSDALRWIQYIFNPTISETFVTYEVIIDETNNFITETQAKLIISSLQQNNISTPPSSILSNEGRVNPQFLAITNLSFLKTADPSLTDEHVLMVKNILLNYQLNTPASHCWQFFPFRNYTLESLKNMLSDDNAITVYNDDPFDPFAIARLRIGAFEKYILMQYIQILIQWGDQMFTMYSWESITAATMLYTYAYDLLGSRPEQVAKSSESTPVTFADIRKAYGGDSGNIPQFLIDLEHLLPETKDGPVSPISGHAFNDLNTYFCVPENTQLMSYWDTLDDRLYKIEHSENIKGQYQALPLFQPPINPLDLIKASVSGGDIANVITSQQLLWPYRFRSALSQAQILANRVIDLGNTLLSTLEKRDSETLALLRNTHEGQLLNLGINIKEQRINELNASIKGLEYSKQGTQKRLDYYTNLISVGLNSSENQAIKASQAALAFHILAEALMAATTIAYTIPQVGSPFAMTYGGIQVGSSLEASSAVVKIGGLISDFIAQNALTTAGYQRRSEEWEMQKTNTQYEVDSLDQQIKSYNAQLKGAEQDFKIQQKQIEQNNEIATYFTTKFTNAQLYEWMINRLSQVYYQTYSLAMQAAQVAQTCYQFDSDTDQTFLNFNYWNDQRSGLLAGNSLMYALDQMNTSYLQQDTRRLEIEKIVSLAMLDPEELLNLKTKGKCTVRLDEKLYDYDYPGHYARKIKTINISIPTIIGPYQTIKAILTQTKNSVVTEPSIDAVKYLLSVSDIQPKTGLRQNWAQNQVIAISHGIEDNGLFNLNFEDERYLPFENTGAVSEWTLEMPIKTNRFNFKNISDVLITIKYTALYNEKLRDDTEKILANIPYKAGFYIDASRLQSNRWNSFIIDNTDNKKQSLKLAFNTKLISYLKSPAVIGVLIKLDLGNNVTIADGANFMTLTINQQQSQNVVFNKNIAVIENINWPIDKDQDAEIIWNYDFDLTNNQMKPLLNQSGFIDSTKLIDVEVIILYQGTVF